MFNFFNKSKKLEKILTKANMDFEFFPGKVDKVKKLIEGGADVNALSEADQTALHFACRDRDRIENVVEFVNDGRYDCLFVIDTNTIQRKQLYNLLENAGYNRGFLRKQFTY